MKSTRRTLLSFVSMLALMGPAMAQTPAEKQLSSDRFTVVTPFPAGGALDSLSRMLADGLAKRYNTVAVVDNVPGGAGTIGMGKVKRSKADGHTLLVIPAGNITINPTLMPKFPFDVQKDFVAVTMLATTPNVLMANPRTGFKTVSDVVRRAKEKPGELFFASSGIGSGLHIAGELFKEQAGIDIQHVAYKGSTPAINDLMAGVVPLMVGNLPTMLPHIESGRLVALGLTDRARSPHAPNIPTMAEQGVPGVIVPSWYGLMAPAGTPRDVVDQLAQDVNAMLAEPHFREFFKSQGMTEWNLRTTAFDAYIREETARWAKVIKDRGITME